MAASGYRSISSYGLIGNMQSCALVSDTGSIEWLPLPHVESSSVFAAILDRGKGGYFSVRPEDLRHSRQTYLANTNILQTEFESGAGKSVLTDLMPVNRQGADPRIILRRITAVEGTVSIRLEFVPRFDYGRVVPSFTRERQGIIAVDGEQHLYLESTCPFEFDAEHSWSTLELRAGESCWLATGYNEQFEFSGEICERLLAQTGSFWRGWSSACAKGTEVAEPRWHEALIRSGLALKLLTHPETGALAAAPTTSLPEVIGGERNWDYRYCWIRDSCFTVQALYNLGRSEEGLAYFAWLRKICKSYDSPAAMQLMYDLHGRAVPPDTELEHLEGYRQSRPVRIGNSAALQTQHDIYGEYVNSYASLFPDATTIAAADWAFLTKVIDYVQSVWREPDHGIWEMRSEPQHFTHSKLMCWVALDRGRRMARQRGENSRARRWAKEAALVKGAICSAGYSEKAGSFMQAFGSEHLDATTLLIPILALLPGDHPRVASSIKAIRRQLASGNLIRRYVAEDGLGGTEGCFLLCSFWLVQALAGAGDVQEAEDILDDLLRYASPCGLLAEEADPTSGELLGNYPQAFTHVGVINAVLAISRAKGRSHPDHVDVGHPEHGSTQAASNPGSERSEPG